jgi:hypothetical protein
MKLLELFAGSRSVGSVAEELGFEVFSVDWQPFDKINWVGDVQDLTIEMLPFIPDVVWASPDCTTYSIAAISHHRNGCEAVSDYAKKCDSVNNHFIDLIYKLLELNPNLKFFIENPRGMMRKMPFVKGMDRGMVTYCSYGDDRMKPTDIFTNHLWSMYNQSGWMPRPMCFAGNVKCHHEPAPRGSQTGTQGRSGSYDRSKIPRDLCVDILKSTMPLIRTINRSSQ